MYRKCSSSNRVASFRPTLEVLEDRTVPSAFGQFLQGLGNAVSAVELDTIDTAGSVNKAVTAFNKNPNEGNFISLFSQTVQLQAAVTQTSQLVTTFSTLVNATQSLGIGGLSNDEISQLQHTAASDTLGVAKLQGILSVAISDVLVGFSILLGGGSGTLTPLGTAGFGPITVPASLPGGTGGSVTASAQITNDDDTPVTLSVSGTDGTSMTTTRNIIGNGTISLTVPRPESGHLFTWTLTFPGVGSETATTNFT